MMRRQNRRLNFLLFIVIFLSVLIIFTKLNESPIQNLLNLPNEEAFDGNETAKSSENSNEAKLSQQKPLKSLSINKLIEIHNTQQKIINDNRFGPVRDDTIFVTIQVHDRIDYLRYLIDSFRNAKDIDKTLLIFSHDVYDYDINELIKKIDFAMVMQIFYPFSIQLFTNVFPGTDPRDCGRDIGQNKAIEMKCLNADDIDTYGHYREAKFAQMKHHWWWKLNRIFDQLKVTKDLTEFRLLLVEEDHYVAPDFIHVYKMMQNLLPKECPECNIISLGTYSEQLNIATNNQIEISPWTTNIHNMGMSFNKTTWKKIKSCAKYFCTYDEYNYDFSLQNINRKCLKDKLFTAMIRGPRFFHVGECGIHHAHANCDVENVIKEIDESITKAQRDGILYPKDLEIESINLRHPTNPLINNGGWADLRDQCLCLDMTTNKRNDECHNLLSDANELNDL